MKSLIAIVATILFTTVSAHCRMGETLEQLITRFGEGKKNTGRIRMAGHDQYYFEKDGIGIQCVISDGKVAMEVFHRIGPIITDQDIKEILKTEGDGHSWRFDKKTDRMIRGDNRLEAFRSPGHEDMFFIQEIATRLGNDIANKGKPGF